MQHWGELILSTLYMSNVAIGLIGYVPTIACLLKLYKAGTPATGISKSGYAWWSCGASFTTLYGLLVAQKSAMVWVGGSTLLLNLVTFILIILVQRKHRQNQSDNDA